MNNDLISREALREALQYRSECGPDCTGMCCVDCFCDLIDNAPTVNYHFYQEAYQTGYEEGQNERPQGKWIPVSERLPKESNYRNPTKARQTMDCNKTDCIHYKVCEEWKSLGNDNYINDSYGNCDCYQNLVLESVVKTLPEPYKKGGAE